MTYYEIEIVGDRDEVSVQAYTERSDAQAVVDAARDRGEEVARGPVAVSAVYAALSLDWKRVPGIRGSMAHLPSRQRT